MTVFKNYFRIVKQFLPTIIIFTIIFAIFAVVATSTNSNSGSFTASQPSVAILNNDSDTELLEAFKEYIGNNADIKEIKNDEQSLKDALFYREVDYILIIPENFTKDFMNGLELKIETMKVPDSYSATYTEMLLNRFFSIASVYANSGISEAQLKDLIKEDLAENVDVKMLGVNQGELANANYFYNFSSYTILYLCIYIIGMILLIFNNKNIRKRNLVSSFSYKKVNRQLFFANTIFTLIMWLLYVALGLILYKGAMFTTNGLLLILNLFVFVFSALSIAFLVGIALKNKEAQNAVANILGLGSAFICGAFVPQEFLGDFVLNIAKIFPSYWFIKNNNDIVLLSNFDFNTLQPIFINMLIMIGFGIIFFLIANIYSRLTLKKNA